MIPKLVKVNRKIRAAAAAIAGSRSGNVTLKKTRRGDAPSMAAASCTAGSMFAQKVEIRRTTMAYS